MTGEGVAREGVTGRGVSGGGGAGGEITGVFTGGSLLYGSTGRTDLLGPDATAARETGRRSRVAEKRVGRMDDVVIG